MLENLAGTVVDSAMMVSKIAEHLSDSAICSASTALKSVGGPLVETGIHAAKMLLRASALLGLVPVYPAMIPS
jgi:hypothetical protein